MLVLVNAKVETKEVLNEMNLDDILDYITNKFSAEKIFYEMEFSDELLQQEFYDRELSVPKTKYNLYDQQTLELLEEIKKNFTLDQIQKLLFWQPGQGINKEKVLGQSKEEGVENNDWDDVEGFAFDYDY